MALLRLTEPDYTGVTEHAKCIADKYAHDHIVSALEGGYELHSLGHSAQTHIKVLIGL